jgi:hypothetical protein
MYRQPSLAHPAKTFCAVRRPSHEPSRHRQADHQRNARHEQSCYHHRIILNE